MSREKIGVQSMIVPGSYSNRSKQQNKNSFKSYSLKKKKKKLNYIKLQVSVQSYVRIVKPYSGTPTTAAVLL